MKLKFGKTALGAAVSLALAVNSPALLAEIKIGIAGPQSGPVAQYGDMQFSGARMAIQRINEQGGVLGEKLVAVEADDACEPKQANAVANKMVNEGVKYVVGHLCSSSTQPASDIYYDEGILMVTPAATSPEITDRGYDNIFRTIGLDSMQGPAAADFIAEKIKPKRVAVIHDKQQYGEGIATTVRDRLKEKGVNVVMFEGVTAGQKDFSPLITRMRQENVDFVYYGGYHPELGLILRQAESSLDARFMGPEGVGNPDINTIAGDAAEGLYVTLPPSFDQQEENKELAKAFKDKNEDPSGPFVLTSYAAVQVLADAIEKTGENDPMKVAETMREMTFDTPIGTVEFDEKGDLKEFQFVVYEWHSDGSKTPVE
ncbi:branched-chain amino acid ABC transporter substrate-binding protein [Hydrocarboniclastica marina]|uniref:Branched-chain amino acid ABC transporter substrate-binding protein n=1 Tax=Hydrocarboniclastica marina TaxID=2259620 RepID=A0A4P7XJE7_9ALTE|nr:branched-chain amino acid ABC transporter substrate-binding protein [Hydrocarboniclastica marina]MAM00070.1 leucine ABC transporter subunit substrate-binding protein LivK [Alteromonadaceae bacterium]QCF26893.1 branched-chain amino acid ABC transporter substrate-binding protein [Hydrocarboniclastica marina]|tara:strand:+ start:960 stop:2075 length:1116 start_codon:yes stop_codon:yes gene_type:complete